VLAELGVQIEHPPGVDAISGALSAAGELGSWVRHDDAERGQAGEVELHGLGHQAQGGRELSASGGSVLVDVADDCDPDPVAERAHGVTDPRRQVGANVFRHPTILPESPRCLASPTRG